MASAHSDPSVVLSSGLPVQVKATFSEPGLPARARLVNRLQPLRGTLLRRDGVTPRSGFAWFAVAAKDTNAIFDGSTLRSL
jgi:hypothetical protein